MTPPLRLTPYWTEDAPPPGNLSSVPLPRADVAIIGAGYTGLHAAIVLARAGASVVVFDSHGVGWGASSRNGGMANPGLKLSAPELFKHYGADLGTRLWRWSMDAIDFVERFVTDEAIACNFSRHGQVVLAYKPQHFTHLRDEVTWHRQQLGDTSPQVVGPVELAGEVGAMGYYGGVLDERAAGLHPARYVFGLAEAAHTAGVCIVEHTSVDALRKVGDRFGLSTQYGTLVAPQVLLATNGYTNNIVPSARSGLFAGGSYIITTAPLPMDVQTAVSPNGRMYYDSKHFLNYFRLTPDGRMLFGGRHNLSVDLPLEQSATELRARMIQIFPQLQDAPITHSWSGKLGLTFDLMPHAGSLPSGPHAGLLYAYGYGGHGVAVASYLGHQMGRMLAALPFDNPILELPHARYFFTRYARFFLPLVSSWFRFLDKVS
jgi:glycine/D-amino acid oxidase-like deaminating enzyme